MTLRAGVPGRECLMRKLIIAGALMAWASLLAGVGNVRPPR